MKNILKSLVIGFIVVIFICAMIELSFRLFYGAPLNTYGEKIAKKTEGIERYVLEENIDRKFGGQRVFTNSVGLRDHRPPHKSDREIQILVLGDSYTFGYGVELEESYPFILEKLLNKSGSEKEYEVINAGVPGYDTVQELGALKRIIPFYSPKWIIVGFHPSDLLNPQQLLNEDLSNPLMENNKIKSKEKAKINWAFRLREKLRYNSAFFSWFYRYYKTNLIRYLPPPKAMLAFDDDKFIETPEYQTTIKALRKIHNIAIDNKAQMIVFFVVSPINWGAYPYFKLHKAIEQFCGDNSIYFIDPFKEFTKYDPGELWVASNDNHYNKKGNEIAALSIFSFFNGRQ